LEPYGVFDDDDATLSGPWTDLTGMLEESARVETKNYHGERCCHKAAALRVMA